MDKIKLAKPQSLDTRENAAVYACETTIATAMVGIR
jgi:hypothetical protein